MTKPKPLSEKKRRGYHPTISDHGTYNRYIYGECRCAKCTTAHKNAIALAKQTAEENRVLGKVHSARPADRQQMRILLSKIDEKEIDIRNVMRYAISTGALPKNAFALMDFDQFRAWLRDHPTFRYEAK